MEFIKNNCFVTILLADIHEMLDSPELDLDTLKYRGKTYIELIKNMIQYFNGNTNNINFIYGSSFQTSPSYTCDLYKISSLTTIQEIFNSREINKNTETEETIEICKKPMTTMLYPILQALDEKYTVNKNRKNRKFYILKNI